MRVGVFRWHLLAPRGPLRVALRAWERRGQSCLSLQCFRVAEDRKVSDKDAAILRMQAVDTRVSAVAEGPRDAS